MSASEAQALAVAIVVCWLVLLIRFLQAVGKRKVKTINWKVWGITLCFTMAGTTYHPIVVELIRGNVGDWMTSIPRTTFAVIACILGASLCSKFLPTYRIPRWQWPAFSGFLLLTAYILTMLVSGTVSDLWRTRLADLLFNFYVLMVIIRIYLPAYRWLYRCEEYMPMKARIMLLIGLCLTICLWMIMEIVAEVLYALGLPNQLLLSIRPLRILAVLIFFVLSFFAPESVYQWLAEVGRYLGYLVQYYLVHRVERNICIVLHEPYSDISLKDVLRDPVLSVYQSAIVILDARKLLSATPPYSIGHNLANRLELAAQSNLQFDTVISRLSRIGRDDLWYSLKSPLRLRKGL